MSSKLSVNHRKQSRRNICVIKTTDSCKNIKLQLPTFRNTNIFVACAKISDWLGRRFAIEMNNRMNKFHNTDEDFEESISSPIFFSTLLVVIIPFTTADTRAAEKRTSNQKQVT